jgi:lactaldehyde dehydrogenase/glycolaldehyde dehydrogenase
MISFTGSVETGSSIMKEAAKNITKVNLELGGKAPAIVLADADIEKAATNIKNARVINSGQVCNCVERVYVQENILDEFTDKLTNVMKSVNFGNPNNEENIEYGPMINKEGLNKVESLVSTAKNDGAEIITGGNSKKIEEGSYYEPTVLANCKQNMEIVRKEIFGPVLPIISFKDLDQAIEFANDCEYGLTSSIFTSNIKTAMRAANEIKFGETMINRENMEIFQAFHAGVRKSGIGGADGKHGLYEYTQTHGVYINYE